MQLVVIFSVKLTDKFHKRFLSVIGIELRQDAIRCIKHLCNVRIKISKDSEPNFKIFACELIFSTVPHLHYLNLFISNIICSYQDIVLQNPLILLSSSHSQMTDRHQTISGFLWSIWCSDVLQHLTKSLTCNPLQIRGYKKTFLCPSVWAWSMNYIIIDRIIWIILFLWDILLVLKHICWN